MANWLGWAATALFTASYFCRGAESLRRVQMVAALMWVAYGVMVHAVPVVAANLLVMAAAAFASWNGRTSAGGGSAPSEA
jgi:hypothetical protein